MSRIAVTTLGTLGDLHPMIAIALELRQRGHSVVFVTHEVYRSKLQALGFEFHAMRPDFTAMNDPQEMAQMMDLKTGQEYMVRQWVNPHLREMYTDLLNVAKSADFIFSGEGVIATPLVAEKLGMQWASSAMVPLSFFSIYDPPVLAPFPALAKLYKLGPLVNRGVLNFAKIVSNSWAEPIRQLRQELGLSPIDYNPFLENRFSPYLVVALFSSVFGQPQPDWPANTIVAGFTFYDGAQEGAELVPELKQFLEAGDPPIVFTLGSAAVMNAGNFYQESLQAVEQLNRRAVFLMGNNPPLENLPANVLAVNYAPYSQIFPCACAIVHQGGIGTTAQALRAGRPTLIMPYSHDQPDNAARVERLETSRTIPRKQYGAERVARQLNELLENPSYAAKAAEIGAIIRAEDGVNAASDAIEKQLEAA
ncbi:glycosyltransferase family 1 protein [Microcoleus sp. FACHB-1515]|uniref:glycosyltransferase n=1 Tax=Cyanophyceae TaxID=3028117 RepID=UPI001687472F|nr:glycosyltransferase [Microcoleus sp. FACHB-1515]MBD2093163.1 glycosyltransferase family 1 protein [Microcoleus sp. FACHB-1515]